MLYRVGSNDIGDAKINTVVEVKDNKTEDKKHPNGNSNIENTQIH